MTDDLTIREPPKLLVPVRVLEGETLPETLVDFLAPAEIVVLGYHVLPEQTPTEQASMQFEERAQAAVDDVAHAFETAGRTVETRVAFTHDRDQTVARVAAEVDATATLLPNPAGEIEDVLVAIRGAIDTDRLADLVATLVGGSDRRVTVWGVAPDDGDFDIEAAVADARETLRERGVEADVLTTEVSASDRPVADIVERSNEFDVIVMGEGDAGLSSLLFGDESERVAEGAIAPVLIVRERHDEA
ncbi:Universal stress protein family protein [Haloplanus vescus]|uniref:Universal stress protein family protein n=1 Tax=Haloplanus vescus TaxID=555874 RepID=A0A1H3WDT9_9EURY|nr:universal stress protein [Haloplanus vescus]SDZ85297.1 Universal stress protein family protein [Haloplanus vescus]